MRCPRVENLMQRRALHYPPNRPLNLRQRHVQITMALLLPTQPRCTTNFVSDHSLFPDRGAMSCFQTGSDPSRLEVFHFSRLGTGEKQKLLGKPSSHFLAPRNKPAKHATASGRLRFALLQKLPQRPGHPPVSAFGSPFVLPDRANK